MANIIDFPEIGAPKEFTVTLPGSLWLAIMLKLAGRGHDELEAGDAEARIVAQLKKGR